MYVRGSAPGKPRRWTRPVYDRRPVAGSLVEQKGHLRHQHDGPRYVFLPSVSRLRARRPALRHLVRTFFDGSSAQAAAALIDQLPLAREDFDRLAETGGSIVSPASACGVAGLRPTYGRISRHGCMTLRWTLDKVGPLTRSIRDAALVLDAMHGPDGHDETVADVPFSWDGRRDVKGHTHRLPRTRVQRHRRWRRSAAGGRPPAAKRRWKSIAARGICRWTAGCADGHGQVVGRGDAASRGRRVRSRHALAHASSGDVAVAKTTDGPQGLRPSTAAQDAPEHRRRAWLVRNFHHGLAGSLGAPSVRQLRSDYSTCTTERMLRWPATVSADSSLLR